MPLLMIRNDITKMQVDAIVNPSNTELSMGRGTSWAIYSAAGEKNLAAACKKIGGCEAGRAVLTKGFALPSKFIIHAVCPQWTDGRDKEKEQLKNAYRSALQLAAEYGFQSVAFPLLSSGFYNWPKAEAFHIATTVISEFLLEKDMTVYLVLYDHESVEVSKKLFSKIEEYIDDHYVMEHECSAMKASSVPDFASSAPPPTFAKQQTASSVKPKKREKKPSIPEFLKSLSSAKERKLADLMSNLDETFSQMLLRLIDERGLKDSAVYHKANIDRRLFSKIRNDVHYVPTKKTVLAFAIALELSLDETKDLLRRAGLAFSPSSVFDLIIEYCIENALYDIFEINALLFDYDQPTLGC